MAKVENKNVGLKQSERKSVLRICNRLVLNYLKIKAIELKLPFLERKWNRFNEKEVFIRSHKHLMLESDRRMIEKIKNEMTKTKSKTQIAKNLGIKRSDIYLIESRNNILFNAI